jgi:PAS domain S-box-containing protein
VEGQRFSKIMQTTRILALGAALTLCALATGSLGFKVYTHLSEVRQIDTNLSDRHLHKLSLDYERLHFTYSKNSNGHLLDEIQSDIIETINKVQSHAVIQDKILQAQVTLLLDEISQTLARLPSGETRFETNDDFSDTLLEQTETLRDLSAAMSNYLVDLRMTRQLELTKTLNQLIISTACALVAVIIGAVMFLRNYLQSEKRAQDGQRAALQSETILSTTLDAVVVADERGLIRKYNASAERIFGYSAEEALGQDVSDLIIPEQYRRAHKAGMNRFLTSNSKRVIGSGRVKLDARDKQGRQFPVELSLEVMEQNGENLFISFLRDISEEVAAEAELVKARDKALKSEQAKADFLAIMSHEMRTPLNGLTGAIELLETTDLTTSQSKYLNTLRQSASELQHHVNDVLDIAHLEAGCVASVEETFDLRRLIDQVVDDHSELALVNENQLSIDWDENLETLVATDPHKVGQIISNLVNNALKFTKRGQITVQVDRHISPHAEFMIELRVTDTGIGIPDKFLKHIFDDFTTLDNSYTRTSSGVGLGLGIVRRMVAALNGTIGVNSHEGAGSTFWVRIPVQKVPQDTAIAHAEQQDLPLYQTLKILMVEDNDINRFVLREMLVNEGHQVVEAENGKIAIDTLEQGNFDVI